MPDINQLRADTPASARYIHLNNAGASLAPLPVQQVMAEYFAFEASLGGYEAADIRAADINGFYTAIAQLIHAHPRNIAFAGSATDAYARALSAIDWQPGDVLLTTNNDYISNQLAFLSLQKRCNIRLLRARDTASGGVDVADMEQLIRQFHPKLVAVTQVPTNSGLVQPVAEIGKICRQNGNWYLVDACQSAGQMPIDITTIGCDFLTATMRKFMRGPRGAGFLFASDRVLNANLTMLLPDMKGALWTGIDDFEPVEDARRFEHWERSPALMLGSKVAAEYAMQVGLDWIADRVQSLAATTRQLLTTLPDVQVLDQGAALCGIVTAYHPKFEGNVVRDWLRTKGIHTSVATLEVARIDFGKKGVASALRFSPHYYNTEAELEATVGVLAEFSRRLFS